MADDDTFVVGAPLPRIDAVKAYDEHRIIVTWASDPPGEPVEIVNLAPAVFRYKLYAPLREDADLFRTVRVADDGFALAWGEGDNLDMASTTVAELAEQVMTPADFGAFLKRNKYTFDGIAAELGISRRLAVYYAKDREVPRYIALACRYLEKLTTETRSHAGIDDFDVEAGNSSGRLRPYDERLLRLSPDVRWEIERQNAAAIDKALAERDEAKRAVRTAVARATRDQ